MSNDINETGPVAAAERSDLPSRAAETPEHSERRLFDLAQLFKVFGDSTRIKILCALLGGELCVGDIAAALGMGQSAISHQLRLLRASGLVRSRRDGKTVCYALDDSHVHDIIELGLSHVEEKAGDGRD